MRVYLSCLFILFSCNSLHSQTLYVDPVTSAAILVHSNVIDGQLTKTNKNLTLIQQGQLAVTGQLVIVNELQDKIFKGLSEVSGVLNSLSTIQEIGDIGIDIVDNLEQTMLLAKSNPILLLFAEAGAREFKVRATNLGLQVGTFVLKGGKDNLMDSGERAKLINQIATQMRILRGVAYGMHRTMYWARMRGIIRTLNPWASYINMDVRIANDVIREAKYLKE